MSRKARSRSSSSGVERFSAAISSSCCAAEDLVAEGLRVIEHVEVGPPRLARVGHLLAVGVGVELVGVGVLGGLDGLAFLALAALVVARLVLGVLAFLLVLGLLLAALGLLLFLVAFLALAFGRAPRTGRAS